MARLTSIPTDVSDLLVWEACDPETDEFTLAVLAKDYPQLRPLIAVNPAADHDLIRLLLEAEPA